jgi:PASTA domain
MANPLDAFKGLKGWQKGAVVIGGVAVGGATVLAYRKKKSGTGAAAAVPSATSGMVTDPTTGQSYPADSIDPVTDLTYGIELQEYGSIAAADQAVTAQAGAAYSGGATTGGNGGDSYDEQAGTGSTGTATNAQWVAEVESALSQLGYADTDIQQGLARYFSSSPQGTAADGTNLYQMMDTAIGEFGPPPSGTYALVRGGPPPGPGSVTVPDVVGRTDLDTAEGLIRAAGLVPLAGGDNATGNRGKVTSQSPAAGSKVTKGSSVTLTYTVGGGAADVTVPDVTGRTDLRTAEGLITKAGLKATASAASVAASKGNKGKVTSQEPAAGTKVAKGATVTLVYTK